MIIAFPHLLSSYFTLLFFAAFFAAGDFFEPFTDRFFELFALVRELPLIIPESL